MPACFGRFESVFSGESKSSTASSADDPFLWDALAFWLLAAFGGQDD
jgi:hypothetical protein